MEVLKSDFQLPADTNRCREWLCHSEADTPGFCDDVKDAVKAYMGDAFDLVRFFEAYDAFFSCEARLVCV